MEGRPSGALFISTAPVGREPAPDGGQAQGYYGLWLRPVHFPQEGCRSDHARRPSSEQYKKNNNGTLTHAHSLDRSLAPGGAAPRRLAAGRAIRFGCSARPWRGRGPALLPTRRRRLQRLGPAPVEHRRLQRQCDRNQLDATARGGGDRPGAWRALPHPTQRRRQLPEPDHAQGRREGSGRWRPDLALRRTRPSRLHGQRQPAIVQHANKRQRRGDQGRPCALARSVHACAGGRRTGRQPRRAALCPRCQHSHRQRGAYRQRRTGPGDATGQPAQRPQAPAPASGRCPGVPDQGRRTCLASRRDEPTGGGRL